MNNPSEPTYHHIAVFPVDGALGAVIEGVDLGFELSDGTVEEIRRAWLQHLVIFFRNQDLSSTSFLAFARRIGEPNNYPMLPGLEDYPEITVIAKTEEQTSNFGGAWHSDTTYMDLPPMGTMLLAREVPSTGGDTEWANMYAAYDTLSDNMKDLLEPLQGVSSSGNANIYRQPDRSGNGLATSTEKPYEATHPVVRTHPETGRRALYLNVAHTVRFSTMTEKDSRPLLEFLFAHQVRPEFLCRFHWEVGSLALWDNRCTMHNPINDYPGQRRVMHRIGLKGDAPR